MKGLQRKHVGELELLEAIERFHGAILFRAPPPYVTLADKYPYKVIIAKMEQLDDAGLIDWGVSLRTAWLTDEGKARLAELRSNRVTV